MECIFKDIVHLCSNYKEDTLKPITSKTVDKIRNSSRTREDNFNLTIDENTIWKFTHSGCYAVYTSKTHIHRHLKKTGKRSCTENTDTCRKRTRSSLPTFNFKLHCLFCGQFCEVVCDPKNPSRWNKAFLCRTAERGTGQVSFKDVLLQVCDQRGDEEANSVRIRVQGSPSDLHASEARYHDTCRKTFMGKTNIQVIQNQEQQDTIENKAFFAVLNAIKHNSD